jgi:hypothetical protein
MDQDFKHFWRATLLPALIGLGITLAFFTLCSL